MGQESHTSTVKVTSISIAGYMILHLSWNNFYLFGIWGVIHEKTVEMLSAMRTCIHRVLK